MVHLHDLGGLWRRRLIAWPDGRSDSETQVYWLQGPSLYADLRIPARRPANRRITCMRDLDRTMLRFMARQEGFFGRFDVDESIGQWQRAFDYQPDTGIADKGALTFEDGVLIERGVDGSYVEHWSRTESGEAIALALATETGTLGCLVAVGDSFIYARGRTAPLPCGGPLSQLVEDAPSLEAAQDLFDCEISFGRRHGGGLRIERSSHCFREGASLSPALEEPTSRLGVDDLTAEGVPFKRVWRITGQELSSGAPLSRWFGCGKRETSMEPARSASIEKLGAPV
jgi:hypothetical protein